MSEKHKSAKYSQSRIATLIGPGTRIEGNITFTGGLRTDGEIIGDVVCDDIHGTVVVGKLGRITGAVKAPYVVVSGRVDGPIDSSESIEIHPDACVVGGASYKDIVIHEGGVIQGALTPVLSSDKSRPIQVHQVLSLESPTVRKSDKPPGDAAPYANELEKPAGHRRKWIVAVALVIVVVAVVAVVWMNLNPAVVASATDTPFAAAPLAAAPPDMKPGIVDVNVLPKTTNAATDNSLSPPAPTASAAPVERPNPATTSAVPLVPNAQVVIKDTVSAIPPGKPEFDPKSVTVVRGDSPSKPSEFVYVVAGKEPAVLYKKQRDDPAEGTRISLTQGGSRRITIAKDDIVRLAQGRGIQMFFQGRKVALSTLEGGAWISFVPNARGAGNEQ